MLAIENEYLFTVHIFCFQIFIHISMNIIFKIGYMLIFKQVFLKVF